MKKLLQFGCGPSNPKGWSNYDSTPYIFIAKIPGIKIFSRFLLIFIKQNKNPRFYRVFDRLLNMKSLYGDIHKGLPEKSNSVDILYSSHVLEHLPKKEFRLALKESLRILRPGGTFRIVVPNLEYFVEEYMKSESKERSIEFCMQTDLGKDHFENPLSRIRSNNHWLMFDFITMKSEIEKCGFRNVRQAFFNDSKELDFLKVEDPEKWAYPMNIGFECNK